jgi:hypothetical protein
MRSILNLRFSQVVLISAASIAEVAVMTRTVKVGVETVEAAAAADSVEREEGMYINHPYLCSMATILILCWLAKLLILNVVTMKTRSSTI